GVVRLRPKTRRPSPLRARRTALRLLVIGVAAARKKIVLPLDASSTIAFLELLAMLLVDDQIRKLSWSPLGRFRYCGPVAGPSPICRWFIKPCWPPLTNC